MSVPSSPKFAGCEPVGLALVHYTARGIARRTVSKCWTCGRRTPQVERWDGAWYGVTRYCVVCLDGWQDGERMIRPFERAWKVKRAEVIKHLWDDAMLPDRYMRWTDLDIHQATCNVGGYAGSGCPECDADPEVQR